jgi:hypothetical protein
LNEAGAEFLVVGAYALAAHGIPRFTKDLDVWVRGTPQNAACVYRALVAFGAPVGALSVDDLATPGVTFQMGLPPNRIDILTSIDGVDFDSAWAAKIAARYGDQPIHVLSRAHLISNKLASARPQDLVDVELLRRGSR